MVGAAGCTEGTGGSAVGPMVGGSGGRYMLAERIACVTIVSGWKWLKKPVFASGPVIYWSALRKMGITDQMTGFGSLMEHH